MAPNEKAASTMGLKYSKNRDVLARNGEMWLEDKQLDDEAEGLWRIYDNLYDLTDFIDKHPGGQMWLELTKGTDITEAFESHHVTVRPERMLPKFLVRKASKPRHSPYTFKPDGFYKTLQRRVRENWDSIPKDRTYKSKLITDSLAAATFLLATLACYYWSWTLAILAGYALASVTVAAHSFFHIKDNFRMYYFDLSCLSSREWRITHAISHHIYTNTIYDMEISMFEPIMMFLPTKKGSVAKYMSWVIEVAVGITIFHYTILRRVMPPLLQGNFKAISWTNILPFTILAIMYTFGNQHIWATFGMWNVVIMASSIQFAVLGLNAAHHHPDIFHDGDAVREDKDWGLCQLDAVMDRTEITGSHYLVLTTFGDHCLHHLFPTVDHTILEGLYPIFKETCREFGIDLRMTSTLELMKGQFQQLARTEANKEVTDLLKYSKRTD